MAAYRWHPSTATGIRTPVSGLRIGGCRTRTSATAQHERQAHEAAASSTTGSSIAKLLQLLIRPRYDELIPAWEDR